MLNSFVLLAGVLSLAAQYNTVAAQNIVAEPSYFTSEFNVRATPEQVINPNGTAVAGAPGALALYNLRINSDLDILCYNVTTFSVEPPYQSAARTATHIHQSKIGTSGPPRLAFTNPTQQLDANTRTVSECIRAPFVTGILANGTDTGSASGFTLKRIEATPSDFAVDTHTSRFVSGAVRGQLSAPSPLQPPCHEANKQCIVSDAGRFEAPWAGSSNGFAQCYDPNTHVCVKPTNSAFEFLCPKSAPAACGRACYDASIYSCIVNADWIKSQLVSL